MSKCFKAYKYLEDVDRRADSTVVGNFKERKAFTSSLHDFALASQKGARHHSVIFSDPAKSREIPRRSREVPAHPRHSR